MIVIPGVVMLAGIVLVALVAVREAGNGWQDMTNATDSDYERHGFNLGAAVLAVLFIAVLAGAAGMGPLAGMVVTP